MSETRDIGCERALERLVEFVDGELPESEHDGVEQHLRICRDCCSRMEFESRLKERLAALSGDDAPSKTRDRVRELIRRF
jgi:anti-sigma factor (TIGR02949 family)